MRDFSEVEIVISSTWREHFEIDELRGRFSTDIAARISGTTLLPGQLTPSGLVERREWEIVSWLSAHGRGDELWLALDDAIWQFNNHRLNLVACIEYVGLDADAELRLRAALVACE